MRVGIFGGTFDPPHLGHMILASEARYQLELSKVLWVLTPDPPHKRGKFISPVADRRAMVETALAGSIEFLLSTIDIDRPGPHYAVDTVELLQKIYPGDKLVYLMGGDSLRDLFNWHSPKRFVEKVDLIGVMRRPGDRIDLEEVETHLPGVSQKVQFVEAPLLEISAREIRSRARGAAPFKYYVLPEVAEIIRDRGLYASAH